VSDFFFDLRNKMAHLGNDLCVGIDPHQDALPVFLQTQMQKLPIDEYLKLFCRAHIEAACGVVAAVKFQSAFFEANGPQGWQVMAAMMAEAKKSELLVIADAKRGDISSTMAAYGRAFFDQLQADCLTVTPYMGADVLAALLPWLRRGNGVYVVAVTSNASARMPQDLKLAGNDQSVVEALISSIVAWQKEEQLSEDVLGFVCGATKIADLSTSCFHLIEDKHLLLPGFGAQQAQMTMRLQQLRQRTQTGSCLIPLSRGLSGIGAKPDRVFSGRSWSDYTAYIRGQLLGAKSDLAI